MAIDSFNFLGYFNKAQSILKKKIGLCVPFIISSLMTVDTLCDSWYIKFANIENKHHANVQYHSSY